MEDIFLKHIPELAKNPALLDYLLEKSTIVEFESDQVILKPNQIISHIPIVLEGLVKVFKKDDQGQKVLLYYISPGESCMMSFNSIMNQDLSLIKAVSDTKTTLLLVSAENTKELVTLFPVWNQFYHQLYRQKYNELLDTIEVLTFSNKQERIIDYLRKEAQLKSTNQLKTTHQKIANDLGSSREVISRILKKLEVDGQIRLSKGVVELIPSM